MCIIPFHAEVPLFVFLHFQFLEEVNSKIKCIANNVTYNSFQLSNHNQDEYQKVSVNTIQMHLKLQILYCLHHFTLITVERLSFQVYSPLNNGFSNSTSSTKI